MDDPAAHIGLASACVFRFESTRADAVPNLVARQGIFFTVTTYCRM
jgi:hypothetical protein